MKAIKLSTLLILTTAGLIFVKPVLALDLTVTGNGVGSSNTVTVQATPTTNVTQTNETEVTNNVDVAADTGNNTINDTSGDATIDTGDVTTTTQVANDVNSINTQVDGCCGQNGGQDTTVTVTGNGTDTTNTAKVETGETVTVSINQQAKITTTIHGMATTGNNTITDSDGNATITTGNITGNTKVQTAANQAKVEVACCSEGDVLIKIASNGEGSTNTIIYNNKPQVTVVKNDSVILVNNVWFDALTGGNVISGVLGDAKITTGDINLSTEIINDPINVEKVKVSCCNENQPPTPPQPPQPPVTPPNIQPPSNNGNGGGSGSTSSGDGEETSEAIGGAVLGAMLPATGANDLLLLFLANIAMLLFGCYLRRYSGRAPALQA